VPGGRTSKVRWGQNFLVDRNVAQAIVDWAGVSGREVLEIGPGKGILTELLAETSGSLCAVEIDPQLADALSTRFADRSDVRIVAGDALTEDPDRLMPSPVRIVSNLPYDCGTAIVERFLSMPGRVEDMIVMLQREVCERIAASPGGKSYGRLSIHTQLAADVRLGRLVPPGCFRPAPKVESQIVRITPLERLRYEVGERRVFDSLVSVAFQGRRKMMRNTVGAWIDRRCGEGAAESAFESAAVSPEQRPETVAIDRFAALSAWVSEKEAAGA
jgi:16S rRNA (adenine1518-N6/adenine1519-N6)-dimethyltransferase